MEYHFSSPQTRTRQGCGGSTLVAVFLARRDYFHKWNRHWLLLPSSRLLKFRFWSKRLKFFFSQTLKKRRTFLSASVSLVKIQARQCLWWQAAPTLHGSHLSLCWCAASRTGAKPNFLQRACVQRPEGGALSLSAMEFQRARVELKSIWG